MHGKFMTWLVQKRARLSLTHSETAEDVQFKGQEYDVLCDETLTKLFDKPRQINRMFAGGGKSHLHLMGYRS
jgi:hypothetical protein